MPQGVICYRWFKQRLITERLLNSVLANGHSLEDTVEPSVPARNFNLKAYAAIMLTWILFLWPDWALNLGHVGYFSQVVRVPWRYHYRHLVRRTTIGTMRMEC